MVNPSMKFQTALGNAPRRQLDLTANLRLPLKEETAWERVQHEKFRARWGGDPFKDAEKLTAQNFSGKSPG